MVLLLFRNIRTHYVLYCDIFFAVVVYIIGFILVLVTGVTSW